MATLTLEFPDALLEMAKARATEAGFRDLNQFVAQLITDEAVGAPSGLTIDSDAGMESLLALRSNGPFVEMDTADFQQMRNKLRQSLGTTQGRA